MALPSKQQLEYRASEIIDHVRGGRPNEDFLVELKAEWIDPKQAARRIAGHANAARGEPILWLIGVDQENGLVGALHEDLANWYPQVEKEFNEVSPSLVVDFNMMVDGVVVVVLLFETDRAPYVIKNPDGGKIQFEVPWRSGTRVRTAKRSDLLRLLVPLNAVPEFDLLDGSMDIRIDQKQAKLACSMQIDVFAIPKTSTPIVLPFHRCDASFQVPGCIDETVFTSLSLGGQEGRFLERTHASLTLYGPVKLAIGGWTHLPLLDLAFADCTAYVTIRLRPIDSMYPVSLTVALPFKPENMGRAGIKAAWAHKGGPLLSFTRPIVPEDVE